MIMQYAYEAQSFLKSQWLLSHSRNHQHFMESKGSLPFLQDPAIGSYPEPDESSQHPHVLFLMSISVLFTCIA
jgi:hypothetical protein